MAIKQRAGEKLTFPVFNGPFNVHICMSSEVLVFMCHHESVGLLSTVWWTATFYCSIKFDHCECGRCVSASVQVTLCQANGTY